MLSATRQRLLAAVTEQPDSASGLARRLGEPRQRLNYHLRALERDGFVELAATQQRRGLTERIFRAPAAVADRASSLYLLAAASRLVDDVTALRAAADRAGQKLATLAIELDVRFRSAAERAAFTEELATSLARLAARYHDATAPAGRSHHVVVAAHPTRKERP